jgi:uncharacterized protein (DUF736 family)
VNESEYFVRLDNGSFSGVMTIKEARREVLFAKQEEQRLPLQPTHLGFSDNQQIGCLWPRRRKSGTVSFYVLIDDPSLDKPFMAILRKKGKEERFVIDTHHGVGFSKRFGSR